MQEDLITVLHIKRQWFICLGQKHTNCYFTWRVMAQLDIRWRKKSSLFICQYVLWDKSLDIFHYLSLLNESNTNWAQIPKVLDQDNQVMNSSNHFIFTGDFLALDFIFYYFNKNKQLWRELEGTIHKKFHSRPDCHLPTSRRSSQCCGCRLALQGSTWSSSWLVRNFAKQRSLQGRCQLLPAKCFHR